MRRLEPDLVRQANWQKVGGASPPERRSNRTTFLREPCVGSREGAGQVRILLGIFSGVASVEACSGSSSWAWYS